MDNDLEINEKQCCSRKSKKSFSSTNDNNNNNNKQTYYMKTINYNHHNMNLNNNQNYNLDNGSHNNVYLEEEKSAEKCCKLNFKIFKRSLPCLFAWTLLLSTTSCYYVFVMPELYIIFNQDLIYWLIVLASQSVLFLYTVITFLIATFKDPGRYPKSNLEDGLDDTFKSPLYKIVLVKNKQVKTKWCSSCNFYRPLRCSHCSVCNSCIDQFDRKCYSFLISILLRKISIYFRSLSMASQLCRQKKL